MSDGERLLYVYAVTRPYEGGLPGAVTGVAGGPPRPVRHGGLAAVVGSVPAAEFDEAPLRANLEDIDWLSDTARAHQDVVAALTAVTCALPLRLATVCRDEDGVRRLVEEGAERFTRALELFEGRVEWGVKVYADPEAAPEPAPAPAATAAPATGRDYLRRRLRDRQGRDDGMRGAEAVARALHEELSARADAAALHPPQDARLSRAKGVNVLNAAYLVPDPDAEAFAARVGEASRPGVRVELTGPWAPYSFAHLADPDPDRPDPDRPDSARGAEAAR
ncbi:GvpL/GvpF family gas vesicle protein [Streptomyces sp. NPDC001941]|uniref:GvpL/GvpF family gas vesicle protein n=1 Tax=Streptomyces sp. NPDC001941 TaxID=3154659 RepID=UPI003327D77B